MEETVEFAVLFVFRNSLCYFFVFCSKNMSNGKVPYTLFELARRDLLPAVPGYRPRQSCYKFNYVKGSHRAPFTPRTHRDYRMRHLHGLMAFYRNRFYEKDRWYKARIEKPIIYPDAYFVDPYKCSKSLSERLAEIELADAPEDPPIDIGLPFTKKSPSSSKDLPRTRGENAAALERAARYRQLRLDVDAVERDTRSDTSISAPVLRLIAEHYGIFKDLFHPSAYFNPVIPLNLYYNDSSDQELLNPVSYGNTLAPKDCLKEPIVQYSAEKDSLWTLLLTNPDGNLYEEGKEVVHWLICNIPGADVTKGDTIVDYIQPLPPKGTGYHRMVFVLFQQDRGRVDFSSMQKSGPCTNLADRTFHTPSFYKHHEDDVTPAGLSFFQSSWDDSCSKYFHETLNMKEPIYEYEWPKPYVPPQEEIPSDNVAFNLYLDQYRDPRDIEKDLLTKRLKRISPFVNDVADEKASRRRRHFPNLFYEVDREVLPSWYHLDRVRENQGLGKYKAIYENKID